MADELQVIPIPLYGRGLQTDASPGAFPPAEQQALRGIQIPGPGLVTLAPDFILIDTGETEQSGGVEVNGIAGIFPFAQPGDLVSFVSGAVAFGFDFASADILLYHLDTDGVIQRTLPIATGEYPQLNGPQITAFEMATRFYFNIFGFEGISSRVGYGVYDPAGFARTLVSNAITSTVANPTTITTAAPHNFTTGDRITIDGHSIAAVNGVHSVTVTGASTFTIPVLGGDLVGSGAIYIHRPVFDLDPTGGAASQLRFRGIQKHRGGSIIGWGYDTEENTIPPAAVSGILRASEYLLPDVWVPDLSPTSAFKLAVGTLGTPIIACAASGQYTIVGKEDEIFALDGDFSSQFFLRQIGNRHGPVSTTGMASIGHAAVWMGSLGPVISVQGGRPRLLGTDRITGRIREVTDLATAWAFHDARLGRVLWTVRRLVDDDGEPANEEFPELLLIWDYERNEFYTRLAPAPAWSVGAIIVPDLNPPGPVGLLVIDPVSLETSSSFRLNFTPGDPAPDVTFLFEIKKDGEPVSAYAPIGAPVGQGIGFIDATGLDAGTTFDVRGRQIRNGQSDAPVEELLYATTLISIPSPANVDVCEAPARRVTAVWDPDFTPDLRAEMFTGLTSSFAAATVAADVAASDGTATDPTLRNVSDTVFTWVRFYDPGPPRVDGTEVAAATFPITIIGNPTPCP